jgi:hypothetical protein
VPHDRHDGRRALRPALSGGWPRCHASRPSGTGDEATERIAALKLKTYYAGKTRITDRSLEILGRMTSLESIELWETAGVTDAGLEALAKLPRLRRFSISGAPKVTRQGVAVFPAGVRVEYGS